MDELCSVHNQPKNNFCFDLDALVCPDCTTCDDHQGHAHKELTGTVPEIEKLFPQLDSLSNARINLKQSLQRIENARSEMERLKGEMVEKIEAAYNNFIEIVTKQKNDMVEEAERKADEKLRSLDTEKSNISNSSNRIESMMEYVDRCVTFSRNRSLIRRHGEIRHQIDRQFEDTEPVGRDFTDVDFSMEVDEAEDLETLRKNVKTKVVDYSLDLMQHELLSPCHTTTTVQLGEMPELSVTFSDLSLSSGGAAEKRMLPEQRVKPVHMIPGFSDPWDVAVYSPPPPNDPSSLVYYVTDGNKIIKFDNSHNIVKELEVSKNNVLDDEFSLSKLWGVDIDCSTGDVYITGISYKWKQRRITKSLYVCKRRKVIKFNSDLEPLQLINESKGNINLRGVMVTGDMVLVCDNHASKIKTFHKRLLTLIRQAPSCEGDAKLTDISDMSSDTDGMYLYVSNPVGASKPVESGSAEQSTKGSCVMVFIKEQNLSVTPNPQGNVYKYIHKFGDKDGMNMLKSPSGIRVTEEYVYVADWEQHNINVFTPVRATPLSDGKYDITGGEYKGSFGKAGNGKYELLYPWGVDVDTRSGSVYVCDHGNKRIQIF